MLIAPSFVSRDSFHIYPVGALLLLTCLTFHLKPAILTSQIPPPFLLP